MLQSLSYTKSRTLLAGLGQTHSGPGPLPGDKSTLCCSFPSFFSQWCVLLLCGALGGVDRWQAYTDMERHPLVFLRPREEATRACQGEPKGLTGVVGTQLPAKVSKCEKARVPATSHCSTEKRACQALETHVHLVGRLLRPVFLPLTKGIFNFLQRNLLPPAGPGGWRKEPGSELPMLFLK